MSEFKTRAEMVTSLEFIQYVEQLRSGSLGTAQGTNRALERLAENLGAVLEEIQRLKAPTVVTTDGTIAYSAGRSLSWAGALTIHTLSELSSTLVNVLPALPAGVVIPNGSVLYTQLIRNASASVGVTYAVTTVADFIDSALRDNVDRLDYLVLAHGTDDGVVLSNGTRLKLGQSLTSGMFTDSQYAQQTEATLLRTNQRENLNLRMVGGGDITWDESESTLAWTSNLVFSFPFSVGWNRVLGPGSVVIPADNAWYATLSRGPSGAVTVSTGVASLAGGVPVSDNTFVLGIHHGDDDRVYLADGTALSDAETVKLGGVRSGVQWYYHDVGTGAQITDFAAALGGSTAYRVGSGELMVYRNGIKAIAARGSWQGGVYPAGAYVGTTPDGAEDYLEEDSGDGTGSRIIWLADSQVASEPVFYGGGAHDPALEWPASDDRIEAFIGVQGRAPLITIPDGIYGFERTWSPSPTEVRTCGGYLVAAGERYACTGSTPLSLTVTDMIGSETAVPGIWHYVYVGPGASVASPPSFKLSTQAPDATTTGPGVHPDFPTYRLLTSVNVRLGGTFRAFDKSGTDVLLARPLDVAGTFSGVVTGSFVLVDLSSVLPAGVTRIRLRLVMTAQAAVPAGSRLLVEVKAPDFSAPGQEMYLLKPSNSNLCEYTFDALLDSDQQLHISMSSAAFQNVANAYIIGYTEGRHTSGGGI